MSAIITSCSVVHTQMLQTDSAAAAAATVAKQPLSGSPWQQGRYADGGEKLHSQRRERGGSYYTFLSSNNS